MKQEGKKIKTLRLYCGDMKKTIAWEQVKGDIQAIVPRESVRYPVSFLARSNWKEVERTPGF